MGESAKRRASARAALEAAGYSSGRDLLVHASYKSVRGAVSGPEELILALTEAVGSRGRLLFPALSYEYVTARNPVFDARLTRSCVGYLAELFRTSYAQARSLHPTHSVSGSGPGIEDFLAPHALDSTPVGPNSPFLRLRDEGGSILMIGCGLEPCTSMHGVEEQAEAALAGSGRSVDYLYGDDLDYRLVSADGASCVKRYRTHGFAKTVQRYDRIEEVMGEPELVRFEFLGAEAWLIDAAALWKRALEVMIREPRFFVDAES